MFFDSFCIRPQILPFVLNLIICPSSFCFPLLYFLFLISFRFSNVFCFLFSILRQNISLLRWRAEDLEFRSQCRIWFGGPPIRADLQFGLCSTGPWRTSNSGSTVPLTTPRHRTDAWSCHGQAACVTELLPARPCQAFITPWDGQTTTPEKMTKKWKTWEGFLCFLMLF